MEYPYIGDKRSQECYFDNNTVVEAKVKSYTMIIAENEILAEETLAKAVLDNGPVSAAVDASGFQHYKGGKFYKKDCSSTFLSHAITIVGFTPDYWIVKNSWGTQWGDDGYIYMAKGRLNNCGIATYPCYVVAV